MAVRFPQDGNEYWPLPPDYPDLDERGRRLARINACMMQETPEDYVAAWSFFRSYYLFPPATPIGQFYKHGVKPSPPAHYQIVRDLAAHRLTVCAAPRAFAKSTLIRETVLLDTLTRPFWETIVFLAKDEFAMQQLDLYKAMLERNDRILEDFEWYWQEQMGIRSLKPKRGQGLWSNHVIKTTTGAMIHGMSVRGASLGKRPHRIVFDDVEKDDALVKCPSDLIEAFRNLMLNTVYPMAEEGCSINVFGTLLSRRAFLYWLVTTQDPRFADHWHRTLLAVQMNGEDLWPEKMGREWQETQKSVMGAAAFNTQYMNDPSTGAECVLTIHPQLCTYHLEQMDQASESDPFRSKAQVITHQLAGYEGGAVDGRPIPKQLVRPWAEVLTKLYRFMTVDWAPTQTESSDFSAIHCMGLENTPDLRDTLWSLDLWLGKVRQHELVREIYKMAVRWQVRIIGVEAFGPYMELYERLRDDLPSMFGVSGVPPAILPITFPTHLDKADRIKGLEWRFSQFRVKLPLHLSRGWPYRDLWYQIENFTDDLSRLQHDDAIDTLAMHQAIGKPRRQSGPDIRPSADDPVELLKAGRRFTSYGIGALSGVDLASIPSDVLESALEARRVTASTDPENCRRWRTV